MFVTFCPGCPEIVRLFVWQYSCPALHVTAIFVNVNMRVSTTSYLFPYSLSKLVNM